MFSRMRVMEGACVVSLVVLCLVSVSTGSVTGTYYSTSVAATANLQGNGYGGPYAITAHYEAADSDGATGTSPVSAHVSVMACPDDYAWDGHDHTYPRSSSNASADFLSVSMSCSSNEGTSWMDDRLSTSATSNGSAEARFEINQTDNWTLVLSGEGWGPWLSGQTGARLFDSNMSLVQEWSGVRDTGGMGDHWMRLSSTDTFACGTYYLYLSASGSACAIYGEPDSANVWTKAEVLPIPAPGVLLLGGIGAGLAGAFRRHGTR